jgi:hypothetical protein
MPLARSFSTGSLFSEDGSPLGPEDLDDAALIDDDTVDMDEDEDAVFYSLSVGPAVACPQLSMDGATAAWEAQRAERRSVLVRQMSTEATLFGPTHEASMHAPPPASPPAVAFTAGDSNASDESEHARPDGFFLPQGGPEEAAVPMMIPTCSLIRTDSLHASWGTHSADVFPSPDRPEQEHAMGDHDRAACRPRYHQEEDGGNAGLLSQLYNRARPLARSVAASAPGPRASAASSTQLPAPVVQDGHQKKKRRVVAKDRPKPKPWSETELQQFRHLLKCEGPNNWAAKAVKLGTGRSAKSLHTRWLRDEGRIIDRPRTVAAMAMTAHKAAAVAKAAAATGAS